MAEEFTMGSEGVWSLDIPRRSGVIVKPGAPLRVTSMCLPNEIETRAEGKLKTTLSLKISVAGSIAGDRLPSLGVGTLIPKNLEHRELDIVLSPGLDYTFEATGNPVDLSGYFIANLPYTFFNDATPGAHGEPLLYTTPHVEQSYLILRHYMPGVFFAERTFTVMVKIAGSVLSRQVRSDTWVVLTLEVPLSGSRVDKPSNNHWKYACLSTGPSIALHVSNEKFIRSGYSYCGVDAETWLS
ncbi:hypothetical protein FA13DRAFT_1799658 [Coprinellus micaceus]|uniref:Nucleoplasmin-like domain-containing protein n=1 Tax=Coprinellus micaceus TaxID=71717 RepID=A0A4Y7SK41_COPMI|nr:hypothetical protein FA13DRAFT_1799658 [Coprinellus micaceus]